MKRYDLESYEYAMSVYEKMEESEFGDWVKYEDVEVVLKENEELKKSMLKIQSKSLNDEEYYFEDYRENCNIRIENTQLKRQIEELKKENERLKYVADKAWKDYDRVNYELFLSNLDKERK